MCRKFLVSVVIIVATVVAGISASAQSSPVYAADNSLITWPFGPSQGSWRIENGYNWIGDHGCPASNPSCSSAYELYSFDFQAGSPGSTSGKTVLSPTSGTITATWAAAGGAGQCVTISVSSNSNYHLMVCHLDNNPTAGTVIKGVTSLGTVDSDPTHGDHIHVTLYNLPSGLSDNPTNRQAVPFSDPWMIGACNYPADGSASQYSGSSVPCGNTPTPIPPSTNTPTQLATNTPTAPPSSSLNLSVSPNSAYTGDTLSVHAWSTDSNYNTTRVILGCGSPATYELGSPDVRFPWSTAGCGTGSRTITAQARTSSDTSWASSISASASVTLSQGTPVPPTATTVNVGSWIRCGPGYSFSGCYANGEYGDGPSDTAWRGADGDLSTQWSSLEQLNSYWQATFQQPVSVAQVSIWGRGGGDNLSGQLQFSDGSSVDFGSLNGSGCRRSASFSPRTTSYVKFQVTGMGNRSTTGFRDIEAYPVPKYPDGDDGSCTSVPGGYITPPTSTPTFTALPTSTTAPTVTPTATPSATPTATPTVTQMATVSATRTVTSTTTMTPSLTATTLPTHAATATPTTTLTSVPTVTATTTVSATVTTSNIRISNLTDVKAVISWDTNVATTGSLQFGATAGSYPTTANDVRGQSYVGLTHDVKLDNLSPATTYNLRLVSGGAIDDQAGHGYSFTTAAVPGSVCASQPSCFPYSLTGTAYLSGAATATPATGALVFITVHNTGTGTQSPGDSTLLSTNVKSDGSWSTTIAPLLADLSDWYNYSILSTGGYQFVISVDDGTLGTAQETISTAVISAGQQGGSAGALSVSPLTTRSLPVQTGWNLLALPVQPTATVTLEGLAQLARGSSLTPIAVVEWSQGQFQVHLAGQNDTFAGDPLSAGSGYFVRVVNGGVWTP